MKLVICEKPSVAKAVASALGVTSRADGCFEGNGLIVSWCVGHLVSPMDAAGYDLGYKKWKYECAIRNGDGEDYSNNDKARSRTF